MTGVDERALACHPQSPVSISASSAQADAERLPVVALIGRPNVGKSTFFAQVTGRFAETSNAPGTTVGVTARRVRLPGVTASVVDLPGAFTFIDHSAGLPVFWQLLVDARPDALVVIADAGDLAGHLPLVLACRDLGLPVVVALNLADEAEARGIQVDVGRLAQLLGTPVYRTVGRRAEGVRDAVGEAVRLAGGRVRGRDARRRATPATPYRLETRRRVSALAAQLAASEPPGHPVPAGLVAAVRERRMSAIAASTIALGEVLEPERWLVADGWARQVERHRAVRPRLADRLARWSTAPWPGVPLFGAVTLLTVAATIGVGSWLSAALSTAWTAGVSPVLTRVVELVVPLEALGRAVLWAVDGGLLAMLAVGIPFVLSFYLLLALLEDSGYLTAAAVLHDRLFSLLGLPGRAAIPVLAATGCNVPAIYGTRVLDSRRERLLASFLIVLTPCSARSAVVIAALAPFAGPLVALAAFVVVAGVAIGAGVAANALVPGRQAPVVLALPPLRLPIGRQVVAKAWHRFASFVRTATPVMLGGSFALGLAYESGALGPIQQALGPLIGWLLGLPAVAGIALILAFLRKELALQLLLVLAIAEYGAGASSLASFMSPGQLFVYAIVTAVSVPCVATLATLAAEFGPRQAALITGATLGLGLGAGALVARLVGAA